MLNRPVPGPGSQRSRDRALQRSLMAEGAAAWRAGLGIERCPPFRIAEMAILWRRGWRFAAAEAAEARHG